RAALAVDAAHLRRHLHRPVDADAVPGARALAPHAHLRTDRAGLHAHRHRTAAGTVAVLAGDDRARHAVHPRRHLGARDRAVAGHGAVAAGLGCSIRPARADATAPGAAEALRRPDHPEHHLFRWPISGT